MKYIKLTQGRQALVDNADYEWLSKLKWNYNKGYALTYDHALKRNVSMHRLVASTPKGMQTDHIDGNGLNNTRANLRICTVSQNMANVGLTSANKSGYRGVSWDKSKNKWAVCVRHKGKLKRAGYYSDIDEAARAYESKARELFGEFVRVNYGI